MKVCPWYSCTYLYKHPYDWERFRGTVSGLLVTKQWCLIGLNMFCEGVVGGETLERWIPSSVLINGR